MGHRHRALIAAVCVPGAIAYAEPGVEKEADVGTPASIDVAKLLPQGTAAPSDGVIASTSAGYAGGPALSESVVGTVGRVSVHADAYTLGASPVWRNELGASVALLRSHAVDLDLGGGYEPVGWNGVPEAVSRVAIGRALAGGRAQLTAALGMGLGRTERYGDFDATANHPIGGGVYVGLDTRLRVDLAQDPDDSPAEREWDAQAAGFAARGFGRFALIASAGAVSWKQRFGAQQAGALATLGVAASFW